LRIFKRHKRSRDERGAVAVEFALIVPVLLTLVFGGIEYGRVFSQLEVLESAAREGARMAATRQPELVQSTVATAAQPYTLTGTPSASMECTPDTVGQLVSVSWTQNFQVDIALVPLMDVNRTITGTFRCE
jgi:Flp pilus assembly protein TadG